MNRKDRASLKALQRLEPCDGKLSCTVPRRAAAGNSGGLSGSSSKWIKTKDPKYRDFYWQAGYGAFSVSLSLKDKVCEYIDNQK